MSYGSNLSDGFQVHYLGSVAFSRGKQQVGISALQRPLLELYTSSRRRGENQRSAHPLALTQQLDIYDYGIVVAETEHMAGDLVPVVTKVITPVSNVILWAAVRFHTRIVKKKVFGAAFVPIACSDGAVDQKAYVQLSSKQRFLVSLTHPSVFACIFRRVATPSTFECHAFVCATAEDALTISSLLTSARQQCDQPTPVRRYLMPRNEDMMRDLVSERVDSSISAADYSPSDMTIPKDDRRNRRYPSPVVGRRELRPPVNGRLESEEESPSDMSVPKPSHATRQHEMRARSPFAVKAERRRSRHYTHSPATAIIGGSQGFRPMEAGSESERTETSWEPWHSQRFSSDYRARGFPGGSSTASFTSREERNAERRDMATMTDPPWGVCREKMELAQTIDLSSETGSSQSGTWRATTAPAVKYTYFGYETYRPPTSGDSDRVSSDSTGRAVQVRADVHGTPMERRQQKHKVRKGRTAAHNAVITGNGTGKITISVPYSQRPGSRTSSSTLTNTSHVPHGVRSFHRNGHVKNWSTLSQTSDVSYQGSATLPSAKTPRQNKMIRWSSDDQLPHRHSFFWSLKRLSLHSLTKAKHKTGKFISSMRTKLMRNKRSSEGSEDSAYDTSEVCLSPSGRQQSQPTTAKARRQQSWSFHDLRTVADNPRRRRGGRAGSPAGSALGSTSARQLVHRRKHRRRRRPDGSSSSDSGVEEYHSDCSAQRSGSDPGRAAQQHQVTRVQVKHGMSNGTFHRWSHTNLEDELGYIP